MKSFHFIPHLIKSFQLSLLNLQQSLELVVPPSFSMRPGSFAAGVFRALHINGARGVKSEMNVDLEQDKFKGLPLNRGIFLKYFIFLFS